MQNRGDLNERVVLCGTPIDGTRVPVFAPERCVQMAHEFKGYRIVRRVFSGKMGAHGTSGARGPRVLVLSPSSWIQGPVPLPSVS